MDGLQMKYFVLKPEGDGPFVEASQAAMRTYADHIEETNPQLANDIRIWVDSAETRMLENRSGQ